MKLSWLAIAALLAICSEAESQSPAAICKTPLKLNNSKPTHVIGTGTPASCTANALAKAVSAGGVIHFNCGSKPVVVTLKSPLLASTIHDTVIDGGGLVTLSGAGSSRILTMDTKDYPQTTPLLTVQRLTFSNGNSKGPSVPLTNGGGAIMRQGGSLDVIDCIFENNRGPSPGQDVAGGAIYSIGGGTTRISGSRFTGNQASNGGAIGNIGNNFEIYNSYIAKNAATGTGGNPGDGGNGGGIYVDGKGNKVTLCGVALVDNKGNKFGGAFFRVSYEGEQNTFTNVVVDGNAITQKGSGLAGGIYLQGGTLTMTNSVITRNEATAFAGVFFATDMPNIKVSNTIFAENLAYTGLGGGITCGSAVTGHFDHITVARNQAPGGGAFNSGISGCGQITLSNSAIVDNTAGNPWNPIQCSTTPLLEGGGNIEGPRAKPQNTGNDLPCTKNIKWVPSNTSSELNTKTFCITVKGGVGAKCVKNLPELV